jgi:hypothetical protein
VLVLVGTKTQLGHGNLAHTSWRADRDAILLRYDVTRQSVADNAPFDSRRIDRGLRWCRAAHCRMRGSDPSARSWADRIMSEIDGERAR